MPKNKIVYVCTECGHEVQRWLGKCPSCDSWNTLVESAQQAEAPPARAPRAATGAEAMPLMDVPEDDLSRARTGVGELDRVLGGGVVPGSLMLVGGDPGIGKSTLLLQVSDHLAQAGARVLYVSGEESPRQIRMRATRLGASARNLLVLSETDADAVLARAQALAPDFLIVDSIQTLYRPQLSSSPGSVTQVRECAAQLMHYAKTTSCAVFLVGHVTKEGSIAGPRVLEHMVDAVLYFEGDRQHQYRILRAVKNRFGSVNELGLFEMTERGMLEVLNPSEALLSARARGQSGSCVLCTLSGSRPVLVDVQALVSPSPFGTPRRMASGVDQGRLALLLAVLEKRAGLMLYNQDVYVNIAGGLSLDEPALDLAVCMAVASSHKNLPIHANFAVMGEIGLSGEARAISQVERRIAECARQGFDRVLLPRDGARGLRVQADVQLHYVDGVAHAMDVLFKA